MKAACDKRRRTKGQRTIIKKNDDDHADAARDGIEDSANMEGEEII